MIQTLERNIKGYEDLARKPLDEDLKVIALTDGCAPGLRHKLELEHREAPRLQRPSGPRVRREP